MRRFLLLLPLMFLTGCGSIFHKNKGSTGAASKAEDRARVKIEQVDSTVSSLNVERLSRIGEYSYGISLDNSNATVDRLNDRIATLANKPTLESMKEMQGIVSELSSNDQRLLFKKDKSIEALQLNLDGLTKDKQVALNNYIKVADRNASLEDQYKATLGQMDKWFGLGAIVYGVKRLFFSALYIIIGVAILYILLRIFADSNPYTALAFNALNHVGSLGIQVIEHLFPKAVDLFHQNKQTLKK